MKPGSPTKINSSSIEAMAGMISIRRGNDTHYYYHVLDTQMVPAPHHTVRPRRLGRGWGLGLLNGPVVRLLSRKAQTFDQKENT